MTPPQKILIVRFSSIGDIVLASPMIRTLRAAFPKAQIDFLVKSDFADLVRYNHHLSQIIELRTREFAELKKVTKKIKAERYDVIFDIHGSLRSTYVRLFSRARSEYVVDKRSIRRFLLVRFKWNLFRQPVYVAERYLETAMAFGVQNDGKGLEVFIPDEIQFSVSSRMARHRLDQHEAVIGIAPGAKHETKMWPSDRFARVALHAVRETGAKVLLFGGPDDHTRCNAIASEVNETTGKESVVNLSGTLTLLETAAALDVCDVVLSNDTGIMHLAAARQRNVVAIFGSTVREFGFFPYATPAAVIEHAGLTCRPCSHIGLPKCPKGHFRCMLDTGVERVASSVLTMLTHQRATS
jgi:lipopolysaccharide heptosyltransferase II